MGWRLVVPVCVALCPGCSRSAQPVPQRPHQAGGGQQAAQGWRRVRSNSEHAWAGVHRANARVEAFSSAVLRDSQAAAAVSLCVSAFPSLFRKRNKQIMAMVKNGVDILVRRHSAHPATHSDPHATSMRPARLRRRACALRLRCTIEQMPMVTMDHCSPVLTFACAAACVCSDSVYASGLAAAVRRHGRTRRNDHFRHRNHRHLPDQQVSVIEELVFRTLCHNARHGPLRRTLFRPQSPPKLSNANPPRISIFSFFFFSFPLWLRINRCLVLIKTYKRMRPNFHFSLRMTKKKPLRTGTAESGVLTMLGLLCVDVSMLQRRATCASFERV